MELLHLTESFCQVVGEGEPGSQAAICQILMEPNWASHIFHCSGPLKVLLHMWTPQFESLYLSKALHQLSHTVSSFLFWRVREDEGILFKDPYKGQFEASLPHALMTPEWFIVSSANCKEAWVISSAGEGKDRAGSPVWAVLSMMQMEEDQDTELVYALTERQLRAYGRCWGNGDENRHALSWGGGPEKRW